MTTPVVLITGALTGIGRATATTFAAAGAHIVVSGRHEEAGLALAEELRKLGGEAEFIRADVRHDDDLKSLVDGTIERFGRLDIAVNNAGTEGEFSAITDLTPETYAATFDTNVLGTLLSMKHELLAMRAQGSGAIVNVSSVFGERGYPNGALYVASKHAVIGLTRSAALEAAAFGVRVNAVGPGPVQTEMLDRFIGRSDETKSSFVATVPLGRAGDPDEIAEAIAFLSSDHAGFMTGQTVFLDGGLTAA